MEDVKQGGEYHSYRSGRDETEIRSYCAVPAAGAQGGIIILRGVAGPDSGYTEIADRLCVSDYAALVHSWQVRGNDPDDDTLVADLQAAIDFLNGRPELAGRPMAVFGYCKGGGFGIVAAAHCPAIRAVVAFHGFARRPDGATAARVNPIDVVSQIRQPVLLLHGQGDQLSPVGAMRELAAALEKAGAPTAIHVYPEADHGFAVSTHRGYRADAAHDSFSRAVAFLQRHLK